MKLDDNKNLVISLFMLIIAMTFFAFASVPLYNIFCKTTGFGGTTQEALFKNTYKKPIGRASIIIKFDANIEPSLDLEFAPEQSQISVKPGENTIIFYKISNKNDYDIYATSIYNVVPNKVAKYFYKIQCFCFEEQLIKAGETRILPVSFYIDSDIEKDFFTKDVREITLSYSFYKINKKTEKKYQIFR